jgi:hypothetical protein
MINNNNSMNSEINNEEKLKEVILKEEKLNEEGKSILNKYNSFQF